MQGFGAKVDARLKELEAICARCTETIMVMHKNEETFVGAINMLKDRIEALEAKRGPGRPPKVPNGE